MKKQATTSPSPSAATFFFTIIFFIVIFLTAAGEGYYYGADPKYCKGPRVNDPTGAYPRYVKRVLAELARVAPTTRPSMEAVARYPDDTPGSVLGTATCDGTTDPSRCASCLRGLQLLLVHSCSHHEGGGARGGLICGMAFGIVHGK